MEVKVHLTKIDVFNIINALQDEAKSNEEYKVFKDFSDYLFNNGFITEEKCIIFNSLFESIRINKKGNITIK